jgi:hypothetical protein
VTSTEILKRLVLVLAPITDSEYEDEHEDDHEKDNSAI